MNPAIRFGVLCCVALLAACGGGGDSTNEAAQRETPSALSNQAMTVQLRVLSSAPQWVSGGDARIDVRAAPGLRDKLEFLLNGKPHSVPRAAR